MKIEVRLFATFRHGRDKKQFLEFEHSVTTRNIVNMLNIEAEEVAILLINGRDGELDRELIDGDVISLFPPVGGG